MLASSLIVALALYASGVGRVWSAAGIGRGVRLREALAFALGWIALFGALASPLHELSERWLSAHMIQHELLMVVAAPLIALGAPSFAMLWVLPLRARRRILDAVRRPIINRAWLVIAAPLSVWLLQALAFWIWHLPSLYDAAIAHEWVHAAEHSCFFLTALLFWWGLSQGQYGRAGYGVAVVYTFATAVQGAVLGALLTVSPTVWYAPYQIVHAGGLTPLEDQQLAGLLMWVPAGLVFVAGGLFFFAGWLKESDRRTRFRTAAGALMLAWLLPVTGACRGRGDRYRVAANLTGGDPHRGAEAITRYGCESCHVIPGIPGAQGLVGPPLTSIGAQMYLAGELPNTPDNMQRWIRSPREVEPRTAMPDTAVTEADGRDIAAYLYTLR
jgi:putative membrane protein